MKKHTLEYIIQNALHEQTARVRVVIKQRFGSSDDQLDARAAGAVYGFRIKAFAKKTDDRVATQSEVYRAIGIHAIKDPTIAKYANDNYAILVSNDQRDAERNYMFTFWVFPAAYWDDMTTLNKDSAGSDRVSFEGRFSGFRIGKITRLFTYDGVKQTLTDTPKYIMDPAKTRRFVEWLRQLNKINKPADMSDIQMPDLENLPETQPAPEDFRITFDPKTPWGYMEGMPEMTFDGTLKMPAQTPIEGTVTDDTNTVLFKGIFKTNTENPPEVIPGKGDATSLPFKRMLNNEPIVARFTGKVDNGYPIEGKVQIDATTEYEGTLNKFAFYNGVYSENGVVTRFYENGDQYAYTSSFSGDVGRRSPIIYIKELQQDLIAMYDNNTEVFGSFSTLDNSFKTLKQTGATGIWDSNMEDIAYAINIVVYTTASVNRTAETKQNAKMLIPEKSHKFIIQHKTEKL